MGFITCRGPLFLTAIRTPNLTMVVKKLPLFTPGFCGAINPITAVSCERLKLLNPHPPNMAISLKSCRLGRPHVSRRSPNGYTSSLNKKSQNSRFSAIWNQLRGCFTQRQRQEDRSKETTPCSFKGKVFKEGKILSKVTENYQRSNVVTTFTTKVDDKLASTVSD